MHAIASSMTLLGGFKEYKSHCGFKSKLISRFSEHADEVTCSMCRNTLLRGEGDLSTGRKIDVRSAENIVAMYPVIGDHGKSVAIVVQKQRRGRVNWSLHHVENDDEKGTIIKDNLASLAAAVRDATVMHRTRQL